MHVCSDHAAFFCFCFLLCLFVAVVVFWEPWLCWNHRQTSRQRNWPRNLTTNVEEPNRIPFTLTYYPPNLAVKNVTIKNFKILGNDPKTKNIFPLPPLISFKREKNKSNFLVRSAFKSENQPGTLHAHDAKLVLLFCNIVKVSGPNWSAKITDHRGEIRRKLADRFREQLEMQKRKGFRCVQTIFTPS